MLLISYIQIAAWNNPSPSAQPCFNNLHFSLLEKQGLHPPANPYPEAVSRSSRYSLKFSRNQTHKGEWILFIYQCVFSYPNRIEKGKKPFQHGNVPLYIKVFLESHPICNLSGNRYNGGDLRKRWFSHRHKYYLGLIFIISVFLRAPPVFYEN
jgi:hypothetical protein